MGAKTIRRALQDLEAYGYIEIVEQARIQGAQKCNLYRLQPFLDAAQERFQTTPEKAPLPLLGVHVAKHGHPVHPVVRSSLGIYSPKSTASSLPRRIETPILRAAAVITSPTPQPPNPTDTLRVAALRSVGMTNPEVLVHRWDAIPEAVFMAKVKQALSADNPKGNRAGWLRNALDGVLRDQTLNYLTNTRNRLTRRARGPQRSRTPLRRRHQWATHESSGCHYGAEGR